MVLSTAIPKVIAAMVIVIMSIGMPNQPMRLNTVAAAKRFGLMPINARDKQLNKIINMNIMAKQTTPTVRH